MPVAEDWQYLTSKFGKVPDKGWQIANEVVMAAQAAGHKVTFLWGDGQTMDHKLNHTEGHPVIDFMVPDHESGQFVRDYIWKTRQRTGLRHVIWEQHITSTVTQPGVIRKMNDRGSVTANHFDHVHSEWFAGNYVAPDGSDNSVQVDEWLDVDGELGPKTIAKWQKIMGTPVDGVISKPYSTMVFWLQKYLKDRTDSRLETDGELGPKTIRALQAYLGAPTTGVMDSNTVKALQRRLNEGRF